MRYLPLIKLAGERLGAVKHSREEDVTAFTAQVFSAQFFNLEPNETLVGIQ